MYLPGKASRARVREAENARRNRAEILKAWSQGQVSRRDLIKMGLFTTAGTLVLQNGLSPFARSAYADDSSIPTGLARSPLFGVQAFTQPMPRFDVLPRNAVSVLSPAPTARANTTQQRLNTALEGVRPGDTGPIEGRPPGPIWAHQEFTLFSPRVSIEMTTEGAKVNSVYNPGVASTFNSGINAATGFRPTFHPGLPDQSPLALWTFNGTLPPKLMQVRYGEPVLYRQRNKLPFDVTQNGGFGRHTTSTHEHNGHHGAENDGFTGAFFFPGQFYDYHYPIVLAGWRTINTAATDPRAGGPDDSDGITKVLGDQMTVNLAYKPFFEVERRKYRFRIQNGAVARFFKISLSDGSPMIYIANDGNLLPNPVGATQLDQQGIGERYDIVIDFSRYSVGQKVWMVNLLEHSDGTRPRRTLSLADALAGNSSDPCVGKFLGFRIVRNPATPDVSPLPAALIPNPDLSNVPVARQRTFVFDEDARQTTNDPVTSFRGPWGIGTSEDDALAADFGRIAGAPRYGTREIWTLINEEDDWDHPIHIHFEEGKILARNGSASNVPAWEKGRKDVYRLRPEGRVTITMQFRDFGGMFMEHCHNTTHEDNAMLLRWEIDDNGAPFLRPLPTPIPKPQGVTFEPPTQILKNAF